MGQVSYSSEVQSIIIVVGQGSMQETWEFSILSRKQKSSETLGGILSIYETSCLHTQ